MREKTKNYWVAKAACFGALALLSVAILGASANLEKEEIRNVAHLVTVADLADPAIAGVYLEEMRTGLGKDIRAIRQGATDPFHLRETMKLWMEEKGFGEEKMALAEAALAREAREKIAQRERQVLATMAPHRTNEEIESRSENAVLREERFRVTAGEADPLELRRKFKEWDASGEGQRLQELENQAFRQAPAPSFPETRFTTPATGKEGPREAFARALDQDMATLARGLGRAPDPFERREIMKALAASGKYDGAFPEDSPEAAAARFEYMKTTQQPTGYDKR